MTAKRGEEGVKTPREKKGWLRVLGLTDRKPKNDSSYPPVSEKV